MPTLLYTTPTPAPSQTDPVYLAGVQAIRDAIDAGKIITASLSYSENGGITKFSVDFTAIRATSNYVCGILHMRPSIFPNANPTAGPLVVGALDSLGNYYYGSVNGPVSAFPNYEVRWWAQ